MESDTEIKKTVRALAALAQETRLAVFRLLVEAGRRELWDRPVKDVVAGAKMWVAGLSESDPQYGGYCANGLAYAIPWGGDADSWRIFNGKLYIFGGQGSRDAYLLDVPKNQALADKYWSEEVNGSNAFWQRTKRTTFNKVAHYKSGKELADEVAKAAAAKK